MNIALIQQIIAISVQAVQLEVQYGPQVLSGLKDALHWAFTSDEITADQQAAVDATFEAAHLQVAAAGAAAQAAADGTPQN